MTDLRPLFIPLKSQYFAAFAAGLKSVEYRLYGPRWNERTCAIGRKVTLSRGYGKASRLTGTVTGFERSTEATQRQDWTACYGTKAGEAACIQILLDPLT